MADNLIPILIGVCTAQRPKMLKACLDSLAVQVVPEHVSLRAVVVDNEAEPNNRAAVEAQAARFPFPLAYEHEPRRGIPFARNRVLDHALAMNAEWIAFIDDDEIAELDWLAQLVSATERYGCDVVQGQVYQFAEGDEPSRENGKRQSAEGESRPRAATDNVIFHTRLIRDTDLNLRFDEELALSGGSDVIFFGSAHKSGAQIVFSAMPVVHERLMSDRLGIAAKVKRQFSYYVISFERMALEQKSGVRSRFPLKLILAGFEALFSGLGKLITGSLMIVVAQKYGSQKLKKGLKKLLKLPAVVAFLVGVRYERYRKISGE